MKFFRLTTYHLLLGALFTVSVFICFVTPIGGSFNDVVTLKMNNVANTTPVKATIVSTSYDSVTKKFYNAKDLFGIEKRILVDRSQEIKIGNVIIAECNYLPSENYFDVVRIERINP